MKKLVLSLLFASFIFSLGCKDDNNDDSTTPSASPATDTYSSEVATIWTSTVYMRVKADTLPPTLASRLYANLGIALYEAVVPGMENYHSLAGLANGLSALPEADHNLEYHWPTVANNALSRVIRPLLKPASYPTIDSLVAALNAQYHATIDTAVYARSVAQGEAVGDAIHGWVATDGFSVYSNCAYTQQDTIANPGAWRPTPPGYLAPHQPCWGQLRTYCIQSGTECPSPAPYAYSEDTTSAFYIDAREVYDIGNSLTADQQAIARFWNDNPGGTGTPPGHSMMIATQILQRNASYKLDKAAEAYAKVGMAVGDAFIQCWSSKYQYNVIRPISVCRRLWNPAWSSLITTPNFPEYTSGHSTEVGASTTVLADLFGESIDFTDSTHYSYNPGLGVRHFNSFTEIADECAMSRLYGGIHFRNGNQQGLNCGRCIGNRVNALAMRSNS